MSSGRLAASRSQFLLNRSTTMADLDPASRRVLVRFPESDSPAPRPTGRGAVFKAILRAAGAVAAATIPVAGPAIGAVIGATGRRRAPLLDAVGGESETLQYLELQREIERETRLYESVSNVMKARHDATMSSIRNIK